MHRNTARQESSPRIPGLPLDRELSHVRRMGFAKRGRDAIRKGGAACWSITCPSAPTTFRFAEILCFCCNISGKEAQDKALLDMQAAIKESDNRRKYPLTHLAQYPEQPMDLPPDMYAYAYPTDPPVNATEEVAGVMQGTKMRNRGKSDEDPLNVVVAALAKRCGLKMLKATKGGKSIMVSEPPAEHEDASPRSSPEASPRDGGDAPLGTASASMLAFKLLLALPPAAPPADAGDADGGDGKDGIESLEDLSLLFEMFAFVWSCLFDHC